MKKFLTVIFPVALSFFSNAQYDSIPFDGYDRTFLIHLPAGYTGSTDLPLAIAMHGGFGSAINLENQSQLRVKFHKCS